MGGDTTKADFYWATSRLSPVWNCSFAKYSCHFERDPTDIHFPSTFIKRSDGRRIGLSEMLWTLKILPQSCKNSPPYSPSSMVQSSIPSNFTDWPWATENRQNTTRGGISNFEVEFTNQKMILQPYCWCSLISILVFYGFDCISNQLCPHSIDKGLTFRVPAVQSIVEALTFVWPHTIAPAKLLEIDQT